VRVVSRLSLLQHELITQGKLKPSLEFKAGGLNPQDPTSKRVAKSLDRRSGPRQSWEITATTILRVVRKQTLSSGTGRGKKSQVKKRKFWLRCHHRWGNGEMVGWCSRG